MSTPLKLKLFVLIYKYTDNGTYNIDTFLAFNFYNKLKDGSFSLSTHVHAALFSQLKIYLWMLIWVYVDQCSIVK